MEKETYIHNMKEAVCIEEFYPALKHFLLFRLKLPADVSEDRLYRLVVFSVQMQMPNADPVFIEEKLAGSDCHQTSYVIKKKCLLMLETEAALGVHPSAEALDAVETVGEYAAALWRAKVE